MVFVIICAFVACGSIAKHIEDEQISKIDNIMMTYVEDNNIDGAYSFTTIRLNGNVSDYQEVQTLFDVNIDDCEYLVYINDINNEPFDCVAINF